MKRLTKSEKDLRGTIISTLKKQGFNINPHLRSPAESKQIYKKIQNNAKMEQMYEHKKFITSFFDAAAKFTSDGLRINPENIQLELREVTKSRGFYGKLFRWWNFVWWSMPYQSAYGRQMRFFLWDVGHDLPFGMFILQSPVLYLSARDKYLDLPKKELDIWANMSMNAQRVGALPPYNMLIGGKMAALAMLSNEIRKRYKTKYANRTTVLQKRVLKPDLLFITTTSAFGKSSMYDRLTYNNSTVAHSIGFTEGMGTFHMPNNIVQELYKMLQRRNINTKTGYGNGPSSKLRLLKKAFQIIGLNDFHKHGIRREVYLFPLVKNLKLVIHNKSQPQWHNRKFDDLQSYWKERWALPRSQRMTQWQEFEASKFLDGVKKMISK